MTITMIITIIVIKWIRMRIVVKDKKETTYQPIHTSVPTERNSIWKWQRNLIHKYKDLEIEIERMWGMKTSTIPVVKGALSLISISIEAMGETWEQ